MGPQLEVSSSGAAGSFRLVGELDLAVAGELAERLAAAASGAEGDLRLDVGELTFVDCAGLRSIIRVARMLPAGHRVVLVRVSASLARLLELTDVAGLPEIGIEGSPGAQ